MASTGSTWGFDLREAIIPILFLGFMALTGAPLIMMALFAFMMLFDAWAAYRRRSSLHQREDGVYVWIEWHGGQRCSDTDPSEPGGEWDSDSDDGDGDGGGD